MKRKRYSVEQFVAAVKQHELVATGACDALGTQSNCFSSTRK